MVGLGVDLRRGDPGGPGLVRGDGVGDRACPAVVTPPDLHAITAARWSMRELHAPWAGARSHRLRREAAALTATHGDGTHRARHGDAVERFVERLPVAPLCVACVPDRFLRRSCR